MSITRIFVLSLALMLVTAVGAAAFAPAAHAGWYDIVGPTLSARGATAARAKSTSPSPKAITATRGRPQTLVFKLGRVR